MPTTTKKPARKPAAKKATTVKRAPAKAAHKTTVRTVKRPTKKSARMQSFRASRPQEPFFTFRVTHQTFYWLILAAVVVGLAVWVLSISIRVQHIYDQIDATNSQIMSEASAMQRHSTNK